MYIKDKITGEVRKYGTNCHDSLRIANDGKTLSYYNLQNGDGSAHGNYRFCVDEQGTLPCEDEVLIEHGANAYFNIGGFNEIDAAELERITKEIKKEAVAEIKKAKSHIHSFSYSGLRGAAVQISEVDRFIDEAIRKIERTNVAFFHKFNPEGRK